MLFIDVIYAGMLSVRVKNFKQKSNYLWNFSCDICGDVSKGKQKARGYIFKTPRGLVYKCHHCGASMSIGSYLKHQHPDLYKQYVFDRYAETNKTRVSHTNIKQFVKTAPVSNEARLIDSVLEGAKCCADLPDTHPVVKILQKRMIPRDKWELIYYVTQFKKFTNGLLPGKFKKVDGKLDDHPRLIFPYFDTHGKVFAYSARAFKDEQPKYYTIKLTDADRVYGQERLDFSKRIYAFEGQIDSLFIDNSVAVSGSSFDSPVLQSLKSILVIVPDNEPRSPEIVKILRKNILLGYNVCFWPESIKEKDVNEMILAGYTSNQIKEIIDSNTFHGLAALARFSTWNKTQINTNPMVKKNDRSFQ